MAIEVTAGHAGAVAYDTAANADAYFTERGVTTWTGTDAVKESALIMGADYLDGYYADQWAGQRTNETQTMAWPRLYVTDLDGFSIDSDTIPTAVKVANYEAALLSLTGVDLEPALVRGGSVVEKNLKAGPVNVQTKYSGGAPARSTFTKIEGLLNGLIKNVGELLRV